jgi:hypothetical protein
VRRFFYLPFASARALGGGGGGGAALPFTQKIKAVDSFETLVIITELLIHVVKKATLQPRRFMPLKYKMHIISTLFL